MINNFILNFGFIEWQILIVCIFVWFHILSEIIADFIPAVPAVIKTILVIGGLYWTWSHTYGLIFLIQSGLIIYCIMVLSSIFYDLNFSFIFKLLFITISVLLITIVAFFEYRERDLIEYSCRPPKCNQKEKVICKENIENIRIDQLGRGLKKIENICKTEKSNLIWSYNNCLINVTEHGEINEPLAFYSETVECYDQKGNVLPDIN